MEQQNIHSDQSEAPHREARVLVVEDETLLSWSLSHHLQKAGFEVTNVDAGDKALEELSSKQFDLIITDMRLPNIDGMQIVANIKGRVPHIPVIMISAVPDDQMLDSVKRLQIEQVMEKPFDLDEMIRVAETLVRRPARETLGL
jgi:DNA-binding NtrC family response regulator